MKIRELLLQEAPLLSPEDKAVDLEIKAIRKGKYSSNDAPIKVRFGNYKIEDGMVCIDDLSSLPFKLSNLMIPREGPDAGKLPFKFKRCGQILLNASRLKSFEGFPDRISARGSKEYGTAALVAITINNELQTLDGISRQINGDLRLGLCHNINWSNAHKHFDYIDGFVTVSNSYNGPMLWALKIPKLRMLHFDSISKATPEQAQLMSILAKHLRTPERNVLACQEELIDNGLKDYAEL